MQVSPDYYVRYMKTSDPNSTPSDKYKISLTLPHGNTHEVSKSVVSEATGRLFVCFFRLNNNVKETVFMRYSRTPSP
jgi:hypothetical protein